MSFAATCARALGTNPNHPHLPKRALSICVDVGRGGEYVLSMLLNGFSYKIRGLMSCSSSWSEDNGRMDAPRSTPGAVY